MSNQIYVFSDPHFGHINMSLKRGFESVEEHDECIVNNWNSVVTKRDTVYLLGDITMEKSNYEILDRLNGHIKVVLGNHDKGKHVPKLLEFVNTVSATERVKECLLTHIPIHPCEIERFKLNIHGHTHENSILDNRYSNVSAEVINYTPVLLNTLIK